MKLHPIFVSGIFGVSICFGQSGFAQERIAQWDFAHAENTAYAFDCRNCEEDISVSITCFKGDDIYRAEFITLEQREDELATKPAKVMAQIGAKKFEFEGKFSQPGLAGPYPIVEIAKKSDFWSSLAKGEVLKASTKTANDTTRDEISLNGSSRALKQLETFCSAK